MNIQTDEQLDKLANFYIYHNLSDRYGWTFEYYVERYLRGTVEL